MGKIIAVVNQKGGVGKTTTAVNLTAALHDLGLRVLLCDFDPQANATSGLGLDKRKCKYSIYDVLINDVPAEDAIVSTPYGDVLPSASDLAGATVELISAQHRERQLDMALNGIKERYDLIFVDCPPSLELLTLNALCAADGILVPVQCEYFALEGLSDLMATLRTVKRRMNPRLEVFGVALTMFDGRTNFSAQVSQEVRRHFPGKVFSTKVLYESVWQEAALGSESSAPVKYDSKFAEIARDAVSQGQISTSMIQRNYEVGFNRAGRIMMQLERAGIVGRQQGAKPRDILYHDLPSLEAKLQELGLF